MSAERNLRFRIRRGEYEIELEGEFEYVRQKFEQFIEQMPSPREAPSLEEAPQAPTAPVLMPREVAELQGIVEKTPEGRPHLTIPADAITAKEALGLILYATHPNRLTYEEISDLLSSSWKTTRSHAVRARASELRMDGKLISEGGRYGLSGAGLQWVQNEIVRKLKT